MVHSISSLAVDFILIVLLGWDPSSRPEPLIIAFQKLNCNHAVQYVLHLMPQYCVEILLENLL